MKVADASLTSLLRTMKTRLMKSTLRMSIRVGGEQEEEEEPENQLQSSARCRQGS